mgnify:FL=1
MTFKRKAVLVEWTDSCSFTHHRWRDVDEAAQLTPSTIQSVGFVLVDVKTHLVLTGSLDESGNTSGTHTIPRGAITRIRRLK